MSDAIPRRNDAGPETEWPPARPFDLTRWFLVVSFVSIVLTTSVSAALLSAFMSDNMLRRDAVVGREFVNSIVRAENAEALFRHRESDLQPEERFQNLFKQIAAIPDVLRANLYAGDRSIIWSSDPEFIGVEFSTNPELDEAFLGELVIEEGVVGEVKKAEWAFLEGEGARFIENYLPITDAEGDAVIGVVELYKSPSALFAAIDRGQRLVWLSAVVAGAVLYFALFWIIRRASRVIREQQSRLVASETLAVVGEMASAVAHGLRNPLASIRSSAELALEDQPSESLKESLSDIVSQSDRLEGWIREFISSARPMAAELEQVALAEVIGECVEVFRTQLEKQRIRARVEVADDLPTIRGNAASLRQVLNSLIANAIEAMPEGGDLAVTADRDEPAHQVRVCIADSGHGVPEQQLHKLFQPFSTSKGTGLGVGLYLARRIIERHRGTLELANPRGGGTLATIRIPVAE
jgi:signal transduction histidine kinase